MLKRLEKEGIIRSLRKREERNKSKDKELFVKQPKKLKQKRIERLIIKRNAGNVDIKENKIVWDGQKQPGISRIDY